MSKINKLVAAAVAGVVLMGCSDTTEDVEPAPVEQEEQVEEAAEPEQVEEPAEEPEPEPEPEPESSLTAAQENAVRQAESYLDTMAFSRSGLINQLEFEQYSTEDATFAVDALEVDWNEQAAKSAESYLDTMAFSRGGLIDQLKFEGFTSEQAEYGVTQAGL